MTACCDRPSFSPTAFNLPADLDILRGAGLAVSVAVILIAPLTLSILALLGD